MPSPSSHNQFIATTRTIARGFTEQPTGPPQERR